MSRTYTVPAGASSISDLEYEKFIESDDNYFLTSDGLQFYVKKQNGEVQRINNIFAVGSRDGTFTKEAESRSYAVPN